MSFPKIVGLDTDWTMWKGYLDINTWGRGNGAFKPLEDNIERVDRLLLRDRTNHFYWIHKYEVISTVIYDILKNGAKLAIVSSNASKPMIDRALYYFSAMNPATNTEWSIVHLASYNEVAYDLKLNHFRRIGGWSQLDYSEMLMFDDEAFNNNIRITLGASFQLLRNRAEFSWDLYQQGLAAWRQAKQLTIGQNPSVNNRVLIAYSGLPTSWINRIYAREGIVEKEIPYRWGFGLYMTSSIKIARYFRDWNGNFSPDRSYVCQIWVKDLNAWINNVPKIWVPESNGYLPQMNNMNWSIEETALNQENRDAHIATRFGVPAPYALFSQHLWMKDMPIPRGLRWTEMVAGTQLFRTMFDLVKLEDWKADQQSDLASFGKQIRSWGITAPRETRTEFTKWGEQDLYTLSG